MKFFLILLLLCGCSSVDIVESPRTVFVPKTGEPVEPQIIWTSRTIYNDFDYLGTIEARSLSYDDAISKLREAAKSLMADAVIDIHYERIGFLKSMKGFAIKFKKN